LQRLTERTVYVVSTLSGLPIRKTFSGDSKAVVEELFRVDRVNEEFQDPSRTHLTCIQMPLLNTPTEPEEKITTLLSVDDQYS